jgi:hypothetical protein
LRAAELAADLGQPEQLERLLRLADVEEADQLTSARIGWCREISQPPMVNDPAKIPALIGFAAQAQAAGAKDLAINLLWRAAQHCWWSNAGGAVRADILAAASRLELPEADPRLVAITAYAEPLRRGGDISVKLRKHSGKKSGDPAVARTLGSAANVIGAFDLGVKLSYGVQCSAARSGAAQRPRARTFCSSVG